MGTLQNNLPTALASLGSGSINDKNVEVKSSNSEKPEEDILQNILFIVVVFMIVSLVFLICWLINVYILDKNGNAISMENWRENPQVKIEIPKNQEKSVSFEMKMMKNDCETLQKDSNKSE